MNAMEAYFANVKNVLDRVWDSQREAMETAAQWMSRATLEGHNLFAFGCSHAGLLALEMYYRTGGMAKPARWNGWRTTGGSSPTTSPSGRGTW